ncbi:MAG: TolC family protein [Pseudobdellovibrionaceae bacterium]
MNTPVLNILTLAFVVNVVSSVAPAAEVQSLSFNEAAAIALENNQDLKAIRLQATGLKYKAAQALGPNSPTLSYQKNDMAGLDPGLTPASEQWAVSYTLLFPGKSLSLSSSLKHQSEAAREDSVGKEIDVLSSLYNNMVATSANEVLERILVGEIKKAKDLITLQEKKYANGQAAQVDILNSRVNLSRLELDLLSTHNEHNQLLNEFMNILGRPEGKSYAPQTDASIFKVVEVPNLDFLQEKMAKNKPALKSIRFQKNSFESMVLNARLTPLPDFQFTAGMNNYINSNAAPVSGLTRDYLMGVSITIPLFYPLSDLQALRSAKADLETAETRVRATEMSAISDLMSAYTNFTSTAKEIKQLSDIVLPAAKASYQLTLSAYSMGRADFLRLNDARSTYIQSEKDFINKKKSLAQIYVQLLQTVGCDFNSKETGPHSCE